MAINGDLYRTMLQVRTDGLLAYAKYIGPLSFRRKNLIGIDIRHKTYTGQVTTGVRKNIGRAVDVLLQLSPERLLFNKINQSYYTYRIGFITLTVSDPVNRCNSEVIKKCLRPFLKWLNRKGAKTYIWKAELQQRGQIHYHVTINEFIHWQDIRNKWNSLQRKAGYLDEYAKREGHFNANSTDVHSVRKIKDIKAYLTKYLQKEISKNQKAKMIKGRVWDCSMNLKGGYYAAELNTREEIQVSVNKVKSKKVIKGDYFSYYMGLKAGHAGYGYEFNYDNWINLKKR